MSGAFNNKHRFIHISALFVALALLLTIPIGTVIAADPINEQCPLPQGGHPSDCFQSPVEGTYQEMFPGLPSYSDGSSINIRYMTEADVQYLKQVAGTWNPDMDYNVMFDGHGTGLSPPAEEEWAQMVGRTIVVELNDFPGTTASSSFDLSTDPFFPQVRSQGGQGSCAAWAITYYAYGYLEAKDNNWADAYSGNNAHLMSPAWTYNKVNGGYDSGSSMYSNAKIIKDWGVSSMANMPYDWHDAISWGNESAWIEAPMHRSLDSYSISYSGDSTVEYVKEVVSSGTPVVFAIDANEYSPGFSDSNHIISSSEYDSQTINHAQTIVGYDDAITDDGDIGAFRVVNSWGVGWGDDGYYWLTYDAFKEIGNLLMLRYIVDKGDYQPSMLATWQFSDPPTREADFEVGIGPYSSPLDTQSPTYSKNSNGYNHTFPDFMCLDITKFQNYYELGNNEFYLEVTSSDTAGTLSSFRIEIHQNGYMPGAPTQISPESPGVPMVNPGYVTTTMDGGDDLTPPTVSISDPQWGEAIPATSLTVSWIGSDSGSGINRYEVKMDSNNWIDVGTQTSQAFTNISQGSHLVEVKAYDQSGNSATDTCPFTVDTYDPQISISAPSDGSVINSTTITVQWTGSDNGSGVDRYEINLDQGGWLDAGTRSSQEFTDLSNGAHSAQVRVFDEAGNTAQDAVSFTIDSVAPTVTITSPQDGDFLDHQTVEVSWSLTDDGGVDRVEMCVDGAEWVDMGNETSTSLYLDPGYHDIEVRAFDLTGVVGQDSITICVDIESPYVAVENPEVGAVLNTGQVTVSWSGSDDLSGVDHYEISVDSGPWSSCYLATSEVLDVDDGHHLVEVMAVDRAGHQFTDSVDFTVDTSAPVVQILSPAQGFLSSSTALVEWQGSDSGTGIVGFHLSLDGQIVYSGADTSFAIGPIADGLHELEITAEDGAGNLGTDSIQFTIDTVAPTLAIISPYEGEELGSSEVTVAWDGEDLTSGISGYWMSVDSGAWSFMGSVETTSIGPLSDGYHQIDLRALDNADNQAMASVHFTIWTGILEIEITSPSEGEILAGDSVTVEWDFSGSPFGLDHFELRLDEGTWTDVGSQNFLTLSSLETNTHSVEVRVFDGEGNTAMDVVTFEIDTMAPELSIISPLEGSSIQASFITVVWELEEIGSGLSSLEARLDVQRWIPVFGDRLTFTSISSGSHTVTLRAVDEAGNIGLASVNFTVVPIPLGVEILQPSDGDMISSSTIVLAWSGNDSGNGIDHFEIKLDDGVWVDVGLNDTYELIVPTDGLHQISIKVVDGIGQSAVSTISFTVDTTPPVVQITSPASSITNQTTITLEWSGSDAISGVDQYRYRWDGGSWRTTATTSASVGPLDDGRHLVEIMASDVLGNSAVYSITIDVDTQAPDIEILYPIDGSSINLSDFELLWGSEETEDCSSIDLRIDGGEWLSLDPMEEVEVSLSGEGEHRIDLRAWDDAGNSATATVYLTLDLTPPSLTIDSPQEGEIFNHSLLTVTWDAEDNQPGSLMCSISIDDGPWTDVGAVSLHDMTLSEGEHSIAVRAMDQAGNAVVAYVSVTIDTTPPSIEILFPEEGSLFNESLISIRWIVDDLTTGMGTVELMLGSGSWQDVTGVESVVTALVDGEHSVTMRALDRAGNLISITRTFIIDTQPPVVVFTSPTDGSRVNTSSITVEWDVEDTTESTVRFDISIDGGVWMEAGTETSLLAQLGSDGPHVIIVRATDEAGHSDEFWLNVTVDTVSPTVTSISPNGGVVDPSSPITITFSEALDTESVEVLINGVEAKASWEGLTLIALPAKRLDYGITCYVEISGMDIAGNHLTAGSWSYQTTPLGKISGRILDDKKRPVADAVVTLSTGETTTTDSDGTFELEAPIGNYTLTISKHGYKEKVVKVQLLEGEVELNDSIETSEQDLIGDNILLAIVVIVIAFIAVQVAIMKRKHR